MYSVVPPWTLNCDKFHHLLSLSKGFLICAIYQAFLSSSLPFTPRHLQGMLYLILRSKDMHSITHYFQNLAALITLSYPHCVTSNVALASAKQTSQRSLPH